MYLAINALLANTPRDQLRILRAKIENEDEFVLHVKLNYMQKVGHAEVRVWVRTIAAVLRDIARRPLRNFPQFNPFRMTNLPPTVAQNSQIGFEGMARPLLSVVI
jgi:hypothetical protein